MRPTLALMFFFTSVSLAQASPPTLTPTGELEPQGFCKRFMDFSKIGGGSVADGKAERIATMTYDSTGQLVGERWWGFDTPVRIISHSYDAGGRLKQTTWRANKKVVLTSRYRYDGKGNKYSKMTSYPTSKERWKDGFRYDGKGRIVRIRQSVNPRNGKAYSPTHRFRYKGGRLAIEEIDRDNDGRPDERLQYRYDANGLLISKHMTPANDQYAEQLTELKYNQQDQLVESKRIHIWPNQPPSWTGPRSVKSYKYDAAGNLIRIEERVTPKTAIGIRTTFDYSCHGNSKPQTIPAAPCRSSYPNCGKP